MTFKNTNRPGFLLGFIDFFTAGLFFLFYMPFGGLQKELETVLGHRVQPYWKAYLLGIPTLFIYTLVWMARISEELKEKAVGLELEVLDFNYVLLVGLVLGEELERLHEAQSLGGGDGVHVLAVVEQ